MQAILLNDFLNFFAIFFLLYNPSSCHWSFQFNLSIKFFSLPSIFFPISIRLNWYFLIKWKNLLVFQSISVAKRCLWWNTYDGKSCWHRKTKQSKNLDRGKKNTRKKLFSRCTSLRCYENITLKIDWTCA